MTGSCGDRNQDGPAGAWGHPRNQTDSLRLGD